METVVYLYNANEKDKEINLDEVDLNKLNDKQLLWINVLKRDESLIKKVAETLTLQDLPIGAILGEKERPRVDLFKDFFRFLIIAVELDKHHKLKKKSLNIIAGKNFVITIHEGEIDYLSEFQPQEKRGTHIGELDAESFIAMLLDLHLISYFRVLETIEEEVDELDEKVLKKELDTEDFLSDMVRLRQNVSSLRRCFLPQREVFYSFSRPDFRQIAQSDSVENFLLLKEHFESAFNAIESSRDTILSLFDLYATKSAQITNSLVQRLTFITLITGLLGVVAGILGMNFEADFIFKAEFGFFIAIGGMILVALSLTIFARTKRWI